MGRRHGVRAADISVASDFHFHEDDDDDDKSTEIRNVLLQIGKQGHTCCLCCCDVS
jgi:hypothetical protein